MSKRIVTLLIILSLCGLAITISQNRQEIKLHSNALLHIDRILNVQCDINEFLCIDKVQNVILKSIDSVCEIECTKQGGIGSGSGFLIAPDTVLTARHVVKDANDVNITFHTGDKVKPVDIWMHPDYDYAVITIEPVDIPYLNIRSEYVTLAEQVVIIGCPFDFTFNATSGRVTKVDYKYVRIWKSTLFLVDCWGAPGSSGSVCLDLDGNVIGIVVGGPNRIGASCTFVLPIGVLDA